MQQPVQYNDEEIITGVLGGELAMFELLIRRYNRYLYKVGRSYGYGHEDTQDLMQDTFVNAYCNLSKFEKRSSFKTWIIKIMLNNCYRKKEKFSFKNETATDINDQSTPMFSNNRQNDTGAAVLNKELGHVVENALENIPFDYRMVFALREITGLSVDATAETMNISQSNVKVRLNRAKAMLRKEIEKSYSMDEIFEFNLIYCDAIVHKVMAKIHSLTI